MSATLVDLTRQLSADLQPVAKQLRREGVHVYDPTEYAYEPYCDYLRRYAANLGSTLLLGMNPGPWGMAQTGVPFGAVTWASGWLGVSGTIARPEREHPSYPVLGWDCERVEVSGDRLWGMLKQRYGTTAKLRKKITVLNYCPLLLLEPKGKRARNLPLNKVSSAQRLLAICDAHLREVLNLLQPRLAVGVGTWAAARLAAVAPAQLQVGKMLHPSPASPLANRGFAAYALAQLEELGLG